MRRKWYKCKLSQINSTNVEFKTSMGAKKVWKLECLESHEVQNNITGKRDILYHVCTTDEKHFDIMSGEKVVILAKPVEVNYCGKNYKFYFPL